MSRPTERLGGLRCLIARPATDECKVVVAILHGYGMRPEDIEPFANSLQVPATFYLPEAPLEADPTGRAWWPIDQERRAASMAVGPRDLAFEHPPGAEAARALLAGMLEELRRRHRGAPLVLVGFSQGGMLACDLVLREGPGVAALGLLSASRICFPEWQPLSSRLAGLPILISHGTRDPDLSFQAGEALRDMCAAAGSAVTWVSFEGGHEIPLVVWRALRKLIRAAIE